MEINFILVIMLLKKKTKVAELRESGGMTEERKPKVHAQRKFAQGSPNFTLLKDREKESGSTYQTNQSTAPGSTYNDPANYVVPDVCPKTEDFLEFLCFRSCPSFLPASLNYFGNPVYHNFPNGVPSSEHGISSGSTITKQEICSKVDLKQAEAKLPMASKSKPPKQTSQVKKISSVNKTKISVGRIHSSFRKTIVNSGIMTRMGRMKSCTDLSASKSSRNLTHKNKKVHKASPLSKRVSTRSQLRNAKFQSSSSSASSNDGSDSDSDSLDETFPSSATVKRRKLPQNNRTLSVKKITSKLEPVTIKPQIRNKVENSSIPVSKNTRQSLKTVVAPNHPSRKASKDPAKAESVQLQGKPLDSESKRSSGNEKSKVSSIKENAKTSIVKEKTKNLVSGSDTAKTTVAAKQTRESSKKLKNPPVIASRRPSRRTKEAATFFMTLIGQEEEFYSSELDDHNILQYLKDEEKSPPKKKSRVPVERNPKPPPSPPPVVRGKRNSVELSTSRAKRRSTILQEAAKRFTESQSSDSDSSDSEKGDSSCSLSSSLRSSSSLSSSSSEEDAPVRSIRTRSFDPTRSSKTASSKTKKDDIQGARAIMTRKKSLNQAQETNTKRPARLEIKNTKTTNVVKSEANSRKRSTNIKRTVETPPLNYDLSSLIDAPVFHPDEKEFNDPIEYLEKIQHECERFGICRIVPPASFKPECQVADGMRFTANNQYVHRMFRRRGTNSCILEAIHRHLRELNINYQPPPCIGGIEVDLPGLYEAVQDLGGPGHVLENNLWSKVADTLKIPQGAHDRFSKLDSIYCKYLLPYATLSDEERKKLMHKIESQKNRHLTDDEDENECVVKGSSMPLSTFYRIARNTLSVWFPNTNSSATDASDLDPAQVEAAYWKLVTKRVAHVCVHSGNIDSGQSGYGFPCNKTSRHPWNLKVLTNNNGSVLRSLGPVPGCTVPTLHVSMLFSASCWYRDPHGLPWIDYLHTGADKIWYGVPSLQESVLHQAMNKLVPDLVKGDKSVWLSSDTVMVPPTMLADQKVSLSRTIQKSGQFVVVWPRAFTSSLSTGYSVSESVCFAPMDWLPIGDACFKELRINNEPTVFSLQQLLWSIAHDSRSTVNVLKRVLPILKPDIDEEIQLRSSLRDFGVQQWRKLPVTSEPSSKDGKKRRQTSVTDDGEMECEICQASLFFSRAECHSKADSPVTWCLMHALKKIKDHPRVTQHIRVFYVHDEAELRKTVQSLQDHIKSKALRRAPAHHRSSTL